MKSHRPLPATHPELAFFERPGWVEFRVDNSRLAYDGSGKVVKGYSAWSWFDALVPVVLAALWPKVTSNAKYITITAGFVLLYAYHRASQVLWESVIALPPHGIQLETHRGFPFLPLFVTRRFIAAASLRDFVITEGLRGWDVRFYLAALAEGHSEPVQLAVAYSHTLPHFPVLLEVYRGVQHVLFPQL